MNLAITNDKYPKNNLPIYLQVNYNSTFKCIKKFIDNYNVQCDDYSYSNYGNEKLKRTHELTAQALIKMYASFCQRNANLKLVHTESDPLLFKCCSVDLVSHFGGRMSKGTTRNHINRLKQAGIILEKTFHGSNARYDLVLNPELIIAHYNYEFSQKVLEYYVITTGTTEIPKEKYELLQQIRPHFSNSQNGFMQQFLLHNCYMNFINNTNREIGNVENMPNAHNLQGHVVNIELNSSFKEHESKNISSSSVLSTVPASVQEVTEQNSAAARKNAEMEKQGNQSLNLYISFAWNLANSILYENKRWAKHEEEKTKEWLRLYFSINKTAKFGPLFDQFVRRITYAKYYVDRNPMGFIPNPSKYFDPKFEFGFVGTRKWNIKYTLKRQQLQPLEVKRRELVNFLKHYYSSPTATNYYKGAQYFGKQNDEQLMDLFYKCISDREAYFNKETFQKVA